MGYRISQYPGRAVDVATRAGSAALARRQAERPSDVRSEDSGGDRELRSADRDLLGLLYRLGLLQQGAGMVRANRTHDRRPRPRASRPAGQYSAGGVAEGVRGPPWIQLFPDDRKRSAGVSTQTERPKVFRRDGERGRRR